MDPRNVGYVREDLFDAVVSEHDRHLNQSCERAQRIADLGGEVALLRSMLEAAQEMFPAKPGLLRQKMEERARWKKLEAHAEAAEAVMASAGKTLESLDALIDGYLGDQKGRMGLLGLVQKGVRAARSQIAGAAGAAGDAGDAHRATLAEARAEAAEAKLAEARALVEQARGLIDPCWPPSHRDWHEAAARCGAD